MISYLPRSAPEQYLREETKVGPLVWDGEVRGLHHLRESILKAPEDEIAVELQYRNTWRGEVDIGIGFRYGGDLPGPVIEAVRATAYATMSLLNLQLDDHMVPAAPFSIREVLPGSGGGMDTGISVAVRNRQELDQDILEEALRCVPGVLMGSPYGEKFRVALELYAAHVTEVQVRVRFLLLVMAMESLAEPTTKHRAAMDLLDRWQQELAAETAKYEPSSEEFQSLDALTRELNFREEDSIRSQIRKLFGNLPGVEPDDAKVLQRRALRVYDKRSSLVHDGYLPADELPELESEARELLEKVFVCAIE